MKGQDVLYDLLHCGVWVENGWNYCPICGRKVIPEK